MSGDLVKTPKLEGFVSGSYLSGGGEIALKDD